MLPAYFCVRCQRDISISRHDPRQILIKISQKHWDVLIRKYVILPDALCLPRFDRSVVFSILTGFCFQSASVGLGSIKKGGIKVVSQIAA